MKIDSDFQYDAFRFVLSGVRNARMERLYGMPTHANPERSIQGWFERIQARIKQAPQLLDPDFADADLDLLLAQVGWDGSPNVDFIDDISEATKRRLIALSVPLWKLKGTDSGLIGALRIFTGKTVIIRNWFFHRWLLDEAGFWYEGNGNDPWLHGTRYTEADDELQWVILNRENIGATDRRLIYDLLTYLRTSGEHFGVVYAAFADDFGRGKPGFDLGGPEEILATFPQWLNVGDAEAADYDADAQKAELSIGGALRTRSMAAADWGPTQRVTAQFTFNSTAEHIAAGDWWVGIRGMYSADLQRFYAVEIQADGTVSIYTVDNETNYNYVGGGSFTPVVDGTTIVIEALIEPQDAGQVSVSVYVGSLFVGDAFLTGAYAFDDPGAGVQIDCYDGAFYVDDAIVLATPNRVQYVGQKAITPVVGIGGPSYTANPDPGLESFEG